MLTKFWLKILLLLPAEFSHNLALLLIGCWGRLLGPKNKKIQPREVLDLHFNNPVGLAAGLDKNANAIDGLSRFGFGFIEIGTLTPKPQKGNPKPRLFRLTSKQCLINRMGFNNCGVDAAIKHIKKSRYQGILGINIGKNADTAIDKAIDDYVIAMTRVYEYASYITINISSPNTKNLRDLQHGKALIDLLTRLKALQTELSEVYGKYVPLLVKIAPDLNKADISSIVKIIKAKNIDGIVATNTSNARRGVELDYYANEQGGLSGAAITDLSTTIIKQLADELQGEIPIIAVGGIMNADDALEKFAAGASLIQLYTGFIYQGPQLISDVLKALEKQG